MSRNYKFHNPKGLYFISFAVVGWLDVFIRNKYIEILLKSLRFCQKNKGLEIHVWCIMSSHLHLVFISINGDKPELLIGDLKRFTCKAIVKAVKENPKESKKEFSLDFFLKEGLKSLNVKQFQFLETR
ncbi:transposase [Chryseobacterium aquaticum]|uniref:transposase n=1 Tax=Chryseobacterium aquaticum TaxID=452084 RepID=UPI002FCAB2E4